MSKQVDFFKPIKRKGHMLPLEEDLKALTFDACEEGLDKKHFPCFRLYNRGKKVGIIVVLKPDMLVEVRAMLLRRLMQ